MMKKLALFVLIAAIGALGLACGDDAGPAASSNAVAGANVPVTAYAHPELLAETAALKDQLNDKSLVIVDLRKKESYDAGHIPGAVWYDPARLKDDADKLHVIADTAFAKLAGDLGIDNTKTVVSYDDTNLYNIIRYARVGSTEITGTDTNSRALFGDIVFSRDARFPPRAAFSFNQSR